MDKLTELKAEFYDRLHDFELAQFKLNEVRQKLAEVGAPKADGEIAVAPVQ